MNMTYPEYYEAESRRVAAEYSIAIAEVKRNYPNRFEEWWALVCKAAQNGEVIPARVLDCIANTKDGASLIRYLRHDHEKSLPAEYLTPEERARQKALAW